MKDHLQRREFALRSAVGSAICQYLRGEAADSEPSGSHLGTGQAVGSVDCSQDEFAGMSVQIDGYSSKNKRNETYFFNALVCSEIS